MVGSAIHRMLKLKGFNNIVVRDRSELDLTNQRYVEDFFLQERPDQVYLAAAKVGGIHANNSYPANFIYQNLIIQANVINSAYISGVKNLLFLGSSCIYPKDALQPMPEEALLSGPLELTNEPYAIAKIAGIKLCESYNRQYNLDYRSLMPTNLYGPGDNYHAENSHVIPAMIRRFHEAKIIKLPFVTIWGSGKPKREFLFVDDMASACLFIMNLDKDIYHSEVSPMQNFINVGFGDDISILDLANLIKRIVGYEGEINYDQSKPDGPKKKIIDSSRLTRLGWSPSFNLEEGLQRTYSDFQLHIDSLRN
jgi:GDP-L-fucose synthase